MMTVGHPAFLSIVIVAVAAAAVIVVSFLYLSYSLSVPAPSPSTLFPSSSSFLPSIQKAYASHLQSSHCHTEQNNTQNSTYYREECWYYDQNRLVKYTDYAKSTYSAPGYSSRDEYRITETWSYYSNGNLKEHCYEYLYSYEYDYPGGDGDGSAHRKDCEEYDQQSRLIEKEKVDEQEQYSCNASGCTDRERKDNRFDAYVYDDAGVYQHCFTIDYKYYSSASTTSEHTRYLLQCNVRAEWTEQHYGREIPVRTWLTSGYEKVTEYWSGNGYDSSTEIRSWYDTQTRRIYTYIYRDWSYSYPECCSGYGNVRGSGWDSLCYPYALQEQHYFMIDGIPTGNEDGTFYRADSFSYEAIIVMLRNDLDYPCEITDVYPAAGSSSYLQVTACYDMLNQVCRKGDVMISHNAPYGEHYLIATVDYRYPYYRYWDEYYWCSSNYGCHNEAPKEEFNYYSSSSNVNLATALVVPYNPRFLVYPFLNISDLYKWSYDKQLSLAVKYLGSQGNYEGDNTLYPDRRALINDHREESYAYQIYRGYGIPTVDPSTVKQSLDIPVEYKLRDTSCSTGDIRVDNDVRGGYISRIAVLRSAYFILDIKFADSTKEPSDYVFDFQQYQLADLTLKGYLYTKAGTIAGDDLATDKQAVAEYEYTYPARSFLRIVSLRTLTESNDGKLIPLTVYRIKIEFIPPSSSEDFDLLSYARMKYNYDVAMLNNNTPDPNLVEMIMCVDNADNTYRPLVIERYNTDFVSFLDRFYMLRLPDKALQVFNASNRLEIPLHYALQSLTPQYMKITVQAYQYAEEVTNVYPLPAYQQYTVYQRDIFLGTGIWTDKYVKRYGPNIVIEPPKYFQIQRIDINSEDYGLFSISNCSAGCTIPIGYGRVIGIVKNEWGAVGLFAYPVIERPSSIDDPYIGWTMLGIAVLLGFTVLMLLKYFRREAAEI